MTDARRWYRGDCHVHSARSTAAELSPDQITAEARALGLDFLAATEHNTTDTRDAWARAGGTDLLVIPGQEITTRTGHWLALGLPPGETVDWRYGVRDGVLDEHLARVRDAGGLTVAAHPHAPYPSGVFAFPLEGPDLVEVWNGPWVADLPWNADNRSATAEWARRLAAGIHSGRWQPAIGNSDTHLAGQLAIPHTVVLAEELSTSAVLAGLRAGHSWIAGTAAVDLAVEVTAGDRRATLGDTIVVGSGRAVVRVEVGGVPGAVVGFHTDRGEVARTAVTGGEPARAEWVTTAADALFVRVEVRDRDGHMAALTNPVILLEREPRE